MYLFQNMHLFQIMHVYNRSQLHWSVVQEWLYSGDEDPETFIEVEAISWENPPKWQELPVLPSVHAYCYSFFINTILLTQLIQFSTGLILTLNAWCDLDADRDLDADWNLDSCFYGIPAIPRRPRCHKGHKYTYLIINRRTRSSSHWRHHKLWTTRLTLSLWRYIWCRCQNLRTALLCFRNHY